MPSRLPALSLLLGLPFACATPAARAPAAALSSAADPAPAGAALSRSSAPAPGRVDGATAKRLVAEGARLVDVRDAESFAQGHIEGAINVQVTEVASRSST
jgi:3-mercaptopyruvate sulfurtransferase SseA